jgi:hypothetical protein
MVIAVSVVRTSAREMALVKEFGATTTLVLMAVKPAMIAAVVMIA